MKVIVALVVVFTVAMVIVPATVFGQTPPELSLYDNFNQKVISPSRWVGYETGSRSPQALRASGGGAFQALEHAYGVTVSGTPINIHGGGPHLSFANTLPVTEIETQLSVSGVLAELSSDCAQGVTSAAAQIGGYFFNDGASTGSTDATGDVEALIGLSRTSSDSAVYVRATVLVCQNTGCSTAQDITASSPIQFGKVQEGQQVEVRIWWDQADHEFYFEVGSGKNAKVQMFSYMSSLPSVPGGATDTAAPVSTFKGLRVFYEVPDCSTSSDSASQSEVLAKFGPVYVNAEAVAP